MWYNKQWLCRRTIQLSSVASKKRMSWWHHLFQDVPETLWEADAPAFGCTWTQVSGNWILTRWEERQLKMQVLDSSSPAHSQVNEWGGTQGVILDCWTKRYFYQLPHKAETVLQMQKHTPSWVCLVATSNKEWTQIGLLTGNPSRPSLPGKPFSPLAPGCPGKPFRRDRGKITACYWWDTF